MKYDLLRNKKDDRGRWILDTGTPLLCRGKLLVSLVILWFQSLVRWKWALYSHIAIVVRLTERRINTAIASGKLSPMILAWLAQRKIEGKWDMLAVFEANGKEVTISPMSTWIKEYKGTVKFRRLTMDRTPKVIKAAIQFIVDKLGLHYEEHILELMGAATKWNTVSDTTDYSCGELWADFVKAMKVLPPDFMVNNVCPDDLVVGGLIDKELRYSPEPACLGIEELIERVAV